MVRLSQRALRDALEFVHVASSADAAEPFPPEVIDLLARLVPGELVNYTEWDSGGPTLKVEQPVVPMTPAISEARSVFCSSFPLSNMLRSSEARALKISDFVSLHALHGLDYGDARALLLEYRIAPQAPQTIGSISTCLSRLFPIRREWLALMRLDPFSYFWTCWNVSPSAFAISVWLISSMRRRMRKRLPT